VTFLVLFVEAPSELSLAGNAHALSRGARIAACYLGGLFVALSLVLLAAGREQATRRNCRRTISTPPGLGLVRSRVSRY
jgi:hypothetical protein